MGIKQMYSRIKESYEAKLQEQEASTAFEIAEGGLIDKFLESREFEIIKEVCDKLEQEYEDEALKTSDLKCLAKKQVFKEVFNKLVDIIEKAKKLDEINQSNYN